MPPAIETRPADAECSASRRRDDFADGIGALGRKSIRPKGGRCPAGRGCRELPKLKLILLWRGLLLKELLQRVERRGIRDRVEIVPERADINGYLMRAHATVLPAKRSDIVKSYPHSLLESLVAGKPVILSDALPMADYVRQHGCGVVVEEVSERTLVQAIEDLRTRYDAFAQRARATDAHMFSQEAMIESYREIYRLARNKILPANPSEWLLLSIANLEFA